MVTRICLIAVLLAILAVGCGGGKRNNPAPPSPLRVLLVGNTDDPAFRNFRDTLLATSRYTLDITNTVPAPGVPYPDILMLHPSGQFGPADIAAVKGYLGNAGVVLMADAPSKLIKEGYGNPGVSSIANLAPISDWFGNATGSMGTATGVETYRINPNSRANKKFDIVENPSPIYAPLDHHGLQQSQLSDKADLVISKGSPANPVFAFAYEPTPSQRVYWQATIGEFPDIDEQQRQQPMVLGVLERALRWAANK